MALIRLAEWPLSRHFVQFDVPLHKLVFTRLHGAEISVNRSPGGCACAQSRSRKDTRVLNLDENGGLRKPPVNKQVIQLSEPVYSYLLAHTREPQVLQELREETASMHGGHMQVSPEQGQFLAFLVESLGVQEAIELGVFTGYSSLAIAMAMPSGGHLVACEKDEKALEVARRYWSKAGVENRIDLRVGPALKTLELMVSQGERDRYDFAFIDADKRSYRTYYELLLQLVRKGGIIAVDNVLFYGKVADKAIEDKYTVAIRDFNSFVLQDSRVSVSTVPIGDGMTLCRKR